MVCMRYQSETPQKNGYKKQQLFQTTKNLHATLISCKKHIMLQFATQLQNLFILKLDKIIISPKKAILSFYVVVSKKSECFMR